MRTDVGSARSCLYMRRTSLAALLTNRSTFSSVRIASRHSLKKCPDPVSAHPQRGVATLTMVKAFDALTIAHGESRGRILGRTRNEGFGAARAKEARKGRVDRPVRDQFVRAHRARRRFDVLDQQHALRSDPAGEPSSKTITCYLPGPWNVLRSAHH